MLRPTWEVECCQAGLGFLRRGRYMWILSAAIWLPLLSWLFWVLLLATFTSRFMLRRKHGSYPPGPKPLPFIGNLFDLIALRDHGPDYLEWGKKYKSDMVYASAFGSHILILNKLADAEELLEKRSQFYSDRPEVPMLKLVGWSGFVASRPYGEYWRLCRKIAHQNFNYESAKKYRPNIQQSVQQLLEGLLNKPDNLTTHNKMLSTSFSLAAMYGYNAQSFEEPMVKLADESMALAGSLLTPDASIINLLPFLGRIPPRYAGPMTSRKLAAKAEEMTKSMQKAMWEFSENTVKSGTAPSSLVTDFMTEHLNTPAPEEVREAINDIAFTTYGGATETTIVTISTFFYLMAKHPEVQIKAQAELDHVIGSNRLPRFEDRESLPYIEALYREVSRWKQPMPLACGHTLTEDDYYKGYFIPKGTMVFGNAWAMAHDESVYDDPFSFKPERFFDEHGHLNNNSRVLNYGFGRRICVGKVIASSMVWMTMASVLACFNIEKRKDKSGNEIELNDEYESRGFFVHKKPYKCSITPRSDLCRELINAQSSTATH